MQETNKKPLSSRLMISFERSTKKKFILQRTKAYQNTRFKMSLTQIFKKSATNNKKKSRAKAARISTLIFPT